MFQVNNLKVDFYYDNYSVKTSYGDTSDFRLTWCEIKKIDGEDGEKILIKVSVSCYFKDKYDKTVGRKRALEAALSYLTKVFGMTKMERQDVWDKYFSISPKSRR